MRHDKLVMKYKIHFSKYGFLPRRIFAAALCAAVCCPLPGRADTRDKAPRNVILISVDALRPDHLGCYGYGRDTSPCLDAFAENAVVFDNAFSQSSHTRASHLSTLTSLYPLTHGDLEYLYRDDIPVNAVTLAEELSAAGFRTAAFTGGASLSKINGFGRGFGKWSERMFIKGHLPAVMGWVRGNKNKGFFLFFHFYDVHGPYYYRKDYYRMCGGDPAAAEAMAPRLDGLERMLAADSAAAWQGAGLTDEDIGERIVYNAVKGKAFRDGKDGPKRTPRWIKDRWPRAPGYERQLRFIKYCYDSGIRYSDYYLGVFFDFLKKQGLWDDSMIIVTADHGEEFAEHGMLGHGVHLYDTLIRVPLMIKMPVRSGVTPKRINGTVELVDVMPTILEACGYEPEGQMQGESLMDMLETGGGRGKDTVYASVNSETSARAESGKVVVNKNKKAYEYYTINGVRGSETLAFTGARNAGWAAAGGLEAAVPEKDAVKMKKILDTHVSSCTALHDEKYGQSGGGDGEEDRAARQKHLRDMKALGYL